MLQKRLSQFICDDDDELIGLLYKVRFIPNSWDKRFVYSLKMLTAANMSLNQHIWLHKLERKYRKQLGLIMDVLRNRSHQTIIAY